MAEPPVPQTGMDEVRIENQLSTMFIQEAPVGVKRKRTRLWRAEPALHPGGGVSGGVVEHEVQLPVGELAHDPAQEGEEPVGGGAVASRARIGTEH